MCFAGLIWPSSSSPFLESFDSVDQPKQRRAYRVRRRVHHPVLSRECNAPSTRRRFETAPHSDTFILTPLSLLFSRADPFRPRDSTSRMDWIPTNPTNSTITITGTVLTLWQSNRLSFKRSSRFQTRHLLKSISNNNNNSFHMSSHSSTLNFLAHSYLSHSHSSFHNILQANMLL
eukprot:m.584538 g.584538  ORF g.584538 m.584538 type:complete len:175 (+) comp57965_c0_seq27:2178-2702(+)